MNRYSLFAAFVAVAICGGVALGYANEFSDTVQLLDNVFLSFGTDNDFKARFDTTNFKVTDSAGNTLATLTDSGTTGALDNVALDAADLTGTVSTDRYSAYGDLVAESKIGATSTQVAQGDHGHTGMLTDTSAPTLSGLWTWDGTGSMAVTNDSELVIGSDNANPITLDSPITKILRFISGSAVAYLTLDGTTSSISTTTAQLVNGIDATAEASPFYLKSNGGIALHLDEDNDSTSMFQLLDGLNAVNFSVAEDGTMTALRLNALTEEDMTLGVGLGAGLSVRSSANAEIMRLSEAGALQVYDDLTVFGGDVKHEGGDTSPLTLSSQGGIVMNVDSDNDTTELLELKGNNKINFSIAETGAMTSYATQADDSWGQMTFTHSPASGAAYVRFYPSPQTGTDAAYVDFFRGTITSGTVSFDVKYPNTTNNFFSVTPQSAGVTNFNTSAGVNKVQITHSSGDISTEGDVDINGGDITGPTDGGLSIKPETNLVVDLDEDNDTSGAYFSVRNGGNVTQFAVTEDGVTKLTHNPASVTISSDTMEIATTAFDSLYYMTCTGNQTVDYLDDDITPLNGQRVLIINADTTDNIIITSAGNMKVQTSTTTKTLHPYDSSEFVYLSGISKWVSVGGDN